MILPVSSKCERVAALTKASSTQRQSSRPTIVFALLPEEIQITDSGAHASQPVVQFPILTVDADSANVSRSPRHLLQTPTSGFGIIGPRGQQRVGFPSPE